MIVRNSQWRSLVWLLALPLYGLIVAASATAEEPLAASEAAEAKGPSDPYQVPEGSVEELMLFIENGPCEMQPRTVLELRRMNQSLDSAADRIFHSSEATEGQRLLAAGFRVKFLSRLRLLGVKESAHKLDEFLSAVANDPAPQLQALARFASLDRKIDSWAWLSAEGKQALVAEVQAGLQVSELNEYDVVLLMKLANVAAETPQAEAVAKTIEQVLPQLRESQNANLLARLPWLEGLARRLELPGHQLEVEGTLLSGDEIDWQQYRGKVVLVGFWATWSDPCVAELESVKAAFEAYHTKGFEVIGVTLDTNRNDAQQFVAERKVPWPILVNPNDEATHWNHPMVSKYAISTIPRAILVDGKGNVIHMNLRGKELHKALAKMLGPSEMVTSQATTSEEPAVEKTALNNP